MEIKLTLTKDPEVNGDFQRLLLEVDAYKGEPPSRYCPGSPDEYEIVEAWTETGRKLSDKEIQHIDETYADEIWELIYEQDKEDPGDRIDYWYETLRDRKSF